MPGFCPLLVVLLCAKLFKLYVSVSSSAYVDNNSTWNTVVLRIIKCVRYMAQCVDCNMYLVKESHHYHHHCKYKWIYLIFNGYIIFQSLSNWETHYQQYFFFFPQVGWHLYCLGGVLRISWWGRPASSSPSQASGCAGWRWLCGWQPCAGPGGTCSCGSCAGYC